VTPKPISVSRKDVGLPGCFWWSILLISCVLDNRSNNRYVDPMPLHPNFGLKSRIALAKRPPTAPRKNPLVLAYLLPAGAAYTAGRPTMIAGPIVQNAINLSDHDLCAGYLVWRMMSGWWLVGRVQKGDSDTMTRGNEVGLCLGFVEGCRFGTVGCWRMSLEGFSCRCVSFRRSMCCRGLGCRGSQG